MDLIDLSKLDECHEILLTVYDNLKDKDNYALPYLIYPSESYVKSEFRVLIIGKETYGWGKKEMDSESWNKNDYKNRLTQLYKTVANERWGKGTGSKYWSFVRKLNILFDNPLQAAERGIGFLSCNTALIGYKYGTTGFNPDLINEGKSTGLEKAFELLIQSLNPNLVILTIGSNLSNGYVKNYLRIAERPLQLDIDNSTTIDLTPERTKRKIIVSKINTREKSMPSVFVTPHPGGCKHDILMEYLKNQILSITSS